MTEERWSGSSAAKPAPAAGTRLPDALQLDLLTIVGRLEQIVAEGGFETANAVVVDRVLTCDLPRLRDHLSPQTLAWAAQDTAPPEEERARG